MSECFVKVARPSGSGGIGERWAREDVSPTLNVFDNTGDTRAVVLVVSAKKKAGMMHKSFGINCQNRSMYPCTEEVSQTIAVCHKVAAIVFGVKYKQSEKSRKTYSENITQALSAGCHDAAVVVVGKKNAVRSK